MAQNWFIQKDDEVSGPFRGRDVLKMAAEGLISPETQIRYGNDGVWYRASEIEGLKWPAAEPSAPLSGPVSAGTGDAEHARIVCPHCWKSFPIDEVNYISRHLDLLGDPVLGPDAQLRFLPLRFSPGGLALDANGVECPEMACPHCHLKIPESLVELPTSFFSIVGAPASGKSYFLTSMVWQIRKVLPQWFDFTIADTDATFNSVLNNYEKILFLNAKPDEYVALPKTELQGSDFSNQVLLDGISVDLPRPFIFNLSPMVSHPYYDSRRKVLERNIVLYDNAGEHFEPGRDSMTNLATVHLVHSDGIIFLYDPLKDARMMRDCNGDDPQISRGGTGANQLALFHEMTGRIRKYAGLKASEKYRKPLVVVIPKYDAWRQSFDLHLSEQEFLSFDAENMRYNLDIRVITSVSYLLRKRLLEISPEVVAAAEGFGDQVYFVPVSALGRIPEFDESREMIGIKPDHLKPLWAEVPFLLQLYLHNLLGGVETAVKNAVEITNYKFVHDTILFSLPGLPRRQQLPRNYWGKTLYCDETQQYFRLPFPPEESAASAQEKAGKNGLDDSNSLIDTTFWAN